jgi:diguanylate cyclase
MQNDKSLTDPSDEQAYIAELKRSISRLSFIGMGLSTDLDQALLQLRQQIKQDATSTQIKKQIDSISKILRGMEEKQESTPVDVISEEVDFLQLLLAKKLPKSFKKQLKLSQKNNKSNSADEVAHQIAETIAELINQIESKQALNKSNTPKQNKPGFFARLFSLNKTQHPPLTAIAATADFEIPYEIKLALQQLIEQLAAMETHSDLALQLAEKINLLDSVDELSEVLAMITGAFVKVSDIENRQFEKFLKSLNSRIDKVNQFISDTINYSKNVVEQSDELDQQLKQSVSSLKTSVEASTSLSEVKQTIYAKMDHMMITVNQFYHLQQNNKHAVTQNLSQLQLQLEETQQESKRLRDELAEQKVRAQTDSLTQLPNRYYYHEQLVQEYSRWKRYHSPLSLVIGDIDFFKKINDTYGHEAGDQVLKELSHYLKQEMRDSDFVARYGGEEFVILLPETNLIDATKAINKLRLGIKQISVVFEQQIIDIAMSFGIAEFEGNDTPKRVFSRADKALYRAKEKGRDQVCCQKASSN